MSQAERDEPHEESELLDETGGGPPYPHEAVCLHCGGVAPVETASGASNATRRIRHHVAREHVGGPLQDRDYVTRPPIARCWICTEQVPTPPLYTAIFGQTERPLDEVCYAALQQEDRGRLRKRLAQHSALDGEQATYELGYILGQLRP